MLGATKKLTVLKSDLQSDDGYALIYSCATNFWLFGIPRKTETAWVLSKKPQVDDSTYNDLKGIIKDKVPSYDVDTKWGERTF